LGIAYILPSDVLPVGQFSALRKH